MILYYIPDEVNRMLKNKEGMALPTVIITLAVLILLGLGLYGLAISETSQSEWQLDTTQAQYLGQSGVIAGLEVMESELSNNIFMDTESIVNHMNGMAWDTQISDEDSFSVAFERIDEITIKITSIGISKNSSKTVTLTVPLSTPAALITNPEEWVAGINLIHGIDITEENSYLGNGIILEGNPIKVPQGGDSINIGPSEFQASAILFSDYNDLSLEQVPNAVSITFDSEAMYFQSGVKLNGEDKTETYNDVLFSFSQDVMLGRPNDGGRLDYESTEGFESYQRYLSFIDGLTIFGYDDMHSNYNFNENRNYGIVRFAGDVYDKFNPEILDKGYYFFDGTEPISIKDGKQLLEDGTLIRIDDTKDIIAPALDRMFKLVLKTSNPQIWDNK